MVETVVKIAIIVSIIGIVIGLLGTVAFKWSLDTSPYLQVLTGFLHVIYYIVPIDKLKPIIYIFLSMMFFRIIVSIVTTIWSLIYRG